MIRKRATSAAVQLDPIQKVKAELWQRPGFLLRRCLQHTSGVFEQSCSEIGITVRQYDYLFVLDKVQQIGQRELAVLLGLDGATNTLVLKILERKGWVQKSVPAGDSRKRTIHITPEGRKVFERANGAAGTSIGAVASGLSKTEYAQFLHLLGKVATAAIEASPDVVEG